MKITQTRTIKTDDRPDAVKIDVNGMTILVNMHNGVVTVDGANHVHTDAGEHNTLVVRACSKSPFTDDGLAATFGAFALSAFDIPLNVEAGLAAVFGENFPGPFPKFGTSKLSHENFPNTGPRY